MHMIGHDGPRLQPVRFAVAFAQLLLDQRCQGGSAQPAFTVAAVEPCFDLAAALRVIRLVQHGFPLPAAGGWEGVMEHESDELADTRRVEVRKITALMPAEERVAAA